MTSIYKNYGDKMIILIAQRISTIKDCSQIIVMDEGKIELPYVPDYCDINGHMFYIKVKDLNEREKLQVYLRENGVHLPKTSGNIY